MLRGVVTVFVAHALSYALLGVLPRSGIAVLGVAAADDDTLRRFSIRTDAPASYLEALYRLFSLEFGKTLDGTSALDSIIFAIMSSVPIFVVSSILIFLTVSLVLFSTTLLRSRIVSAAVEFVSFVPAYLPGFMLLAVSVLIGSALAFEDGGGRILMIGLCIGLPPTCLAVSIVINASAMELKADYVRTIRALGFSENNVQRSIRKALVLRLMPSFDKILSMTVGVMLFTETVFSYPGFGSLVLRAVQRSDTNLLIGAVVVLALTIAIARVIAELATAIVDPRTGEASHD